MPSIFSSIQLDQMRLKITEAENSLSDSKSSFKQSFDQKQKLLTEKALLDKLYNKVALNVESYQGERRWLEGTTYTTLNYSDITNSAKRGGSAVFFPSGSDIINVPNTVAVANGGPTSLSSNSESALQTATVINQGISSTIDFLINGQSSGVGGTTLFAPYSPGAGSIQVVAGGQTNGNMLVVSGSGTDALVLITGVSGLTINISEIVPPGGTIAILGSSVVENISGWTNAERNALSGSRNNILNTLANNVISSVNLWLTALNNQKSKLDSNADERSPQTSEIAAAKVNVNNAIATVSAWLALPNTGSSGTDSKFTDNNLTSLTSLISTRTTQISSRVTQITTALGQVNQISDTSQQGSGGFGMTFGTGLYEERFKAIISYLELSSGVLAKIFAQDQSLDSFGNQIFGYTKQLEFYKKALRSEYLKQTPTGNNVVFVGSTTGFSVSDEVFIWAFNLPSISATVTGVTSNSISLSVNIPDTYTIEGKASINKALI